MNNSIENFVNAVSSVNDLERLTRPMLEFLESVTGLESTYLTTIDEAAGIQRILYSRNSSDMQIPEGLEVPWGDTLCKRAMEEGRPYTDNVSTCWGDSEAARALGLRTYMSQPVRHADGSIFGTLCAASGQSVPLQTGTLDTLARFAKLIAQQVERELAMRRIQQENVTLAEQSLADALTGLPNRRGMDKAIETLCAQCRREQQPLTIAFIDLDGFKQINDVHGHDVGDQFLIHISRKLSSAMRPGDVVARTGGDEFIALAVGGPAAAVGERLSQASAGAFRFDGGSIDYAGASVGAAESAPEPAAIEAAFKQADEAMYAVKRQRKAKNLQ